MDRREFLTAGACAAAMSPSCFGASQTSEGISFCYGKNRVSIIHPQVEAPLRFTVVSDSHFCFIDNRDDDKRENVKRVCKWPGKEGDLDKAFAAARSWGAETVVLTGDIVSFPSFANIEFVSRKLEASGLRWLFVSGNHDWHFEGVAGSDDEQRDAWIGRLAPLYRKDQDPLMSAFEIGGVQFVLIDDSTYHIRLAQLEFVRKCLAKGMPTCLFMHIPFYAPARPEVFSLGCPTWGAATDPYFEVERRQRWPADGQGAEAFAFRDLVLNAPNAVGVFAGHLHDFAAVSLNGVPNLVVGQNLLLGEYLNVELLPACGKSK